MLLDGHDDKAKHEDADRHRNDDGEDDGDAIRVHAHADR